jgi:DNA-binding HxlR family transcriptional regulator/putative sterol carrier protein
MKVNERASKRRSYEQWCAVARALDLVGERWTLLIVRDLLVGPKRYTDLLAGLPGIGTNLLADRLRELEGLGVVERTVLPPPAGATVYRLTEAGAALEPVVFALGRWGFRYLGAPRPSDAMLPDPFILSLRAAFRPEIAGDRSESYELRVGDRVFEVRVAGGRCTARDGAAVDPSAVFTSDAATLFALRRREVSPAEAVSSGRVRVEGDKAALRRFVDVFGWPKGTIESHRSRRAG